MKRKNTFRSITPLLVSYHFTSHLKIHGSPPLADNAGLVRGENRIIRQLLKHLILPDFRVAASGIKARQCKRRVIAALSLLNWGEDDRLRGFRADPIWGR
jgi:hypothetical protein